MLTVMITLIDGGGAGVCSAGRGQATTRDQGRPYPLSGCSTPDMPLPFVIPLFFFFLLNLLSFGYNYYLDYIVYIIYILFINVLENYLITTY